MNEWTRADQSHKKLFSKIWLEYNALGIFHKRWMKSIMIQGKSSLFSHLILLTFLHCSASLCFKNLKTESESKTDPKIVCQRVSLVEVKVQGQPLSKDSFQERARGGVGVPKSKSWIDEHTFAFIIINQVVKAAKSFEKKSEKISSQHWLDFVLKVTYFCLSSPPSQPVPVSQRTRLENGM